MAATQREGLGEVARALTAKGKGILASDESVSTIGKRLEKHGLQNTEANRGAYREILYTAPIGHSISGAILYKEALQQHAKDGTSFVDCLLRQGVLVGVKVDEGLTPLDGSPGETVTKGLAHLEEHVHCYRALGARFAKWRAALKVTDELPSAAAIDQNAEQLAHYAKICQACDVLPIVEPELLIDGTYDIQRSMIVSEQVLRACFQALDRHGVCLEEMLLKPQMVMPGADAPRASLHAIAGATLDVMQRCVPAGVPGIMFLSGGQSEEEATRNLNMINQSAAQRECPWALSFSFGRALQASVLSLWSQSPLDPAVAEQARQMASALAGVNGAATLGLYTGPHPAVSALESLRESFRGWHNECQPVSQ